MPAPPKGSAQRQTGAAHGVEIDHRPQIVHILRNIIVTGGCGGVQSALRKEIAADVPQACGEDRVGAVLNPFGRGGIGRAAVRRIVFEAAVFRRIMRGRDDDAIGRGAARRGCTSDMACESVGVGVYPRSQSILHSTPLAARTSSALAKAGSESACVSLARNSGPVAVSAGAIFADGLGDGQNMVFIESCMKGGAAMAGSSEAHLLGGNRDVRMQRVICRD